MIIFFILIIISIAITAFVGYMFYNATDNVEKTALLMTEVMFISFFLLLFGLIMSSTFFPRIKEIKTYHISAISNQNDYYYVDKTNKVEKLIYWNNEINSFESIPLEKVTFAPTENEPYIEIITNEWEWKWASEIFKSETKYILYIPENTITDDANYEKSKEKSEEKNISNEASISENNVPNDSISNENSNLNNNGPTEIIMEDIGKITIKYN